MIWNAIRQWILGLKAAGNCSSPMVWGEKSEVRLGVWRDFIGARMVHDGCHLGKYWAMPLMPMRHVPTIRSTFTQQNCQSVGTPARGAIYRGSERTRLRRLFDIAHRVSQLWL